MKQNETKIPLNSFYVGQPLLGTGIPGVCLIYPVTLQRKVTFPLPVGIDCRWDLVSTSSPLRWRLCRAGICCHSLCDFTGLSVLVSLGHTAFSKQSIPSGSYNGSFST